QVTEAMAHMGVPAGAAEMHTYAELSADAITGVDKDTVLVFDEAHSIKGAFGGKRSKRGENAVKLMRAAGFNLYASATPFENPVQAKYMAFGGLTGGRKFDDWITGYGYRI
ncbi:strawberry notch family protein, partial [Escherichia coli]|nr:strawberry notch family protein [Escherichia coli]